MNSVIRTKIIATIGPASDSSDALANLIRAGVNVFRLNFSHGSLEEHEETFHRIRKVASEMNAMTAIMADLCGPKIRVDAIDNDGFFLSRGDILEVVGEHVLGNSQRVSTNRPELIGELEIGHRVLIDDGAVRLRVISQETEMLKLQCEVAGAVRTRKGMNFPDTNLEMSALTDEDRINAAWAFANEVDYVAISFVRSAADLRELRDIMPLSTDISRIVAKVETPQAVQNIDEIIETSDVVLVARGDLGVEMDLAQVPLVQKNITRKCQAAGRPVIIATQMLQSMVDQPTATRAEVSDVANAILDSADCIMLSAETSVGKFPIDAVQMMSRIAEETETFPGSAAGTARIDVATSLRPVTTAVAHGASLLANELQAKLVALWTETGNTARLLSKCRLDRPVIGLSPDEAVCRRMSLYYGVIPFRLTRHSRMLEMLGEVDELLIAQKLVEPGDLIVVVAGTRLEQVGSTNALLIHLVCGDTDTLPVLT